MASRLSFAEREEISVGLARGESRRVIAARLGRAASTVSREIFHHSNHRWSGLGQPGLVYRATRAQVSSDAFKARSKAGKLTAASPLRDAVIARLEDRHSPQQIALRLREDFPDDRTMWVSHETIYHAIYLQARGGLRAELTRQKALRSGRVNRRPRAAEAGAVRSNRPWLGLRISDRPAEAADRAVPGHWEGDLLIGKHGTTAIATLVERTTRFVILVALPDSRVSEHVIAQLTAKMTQLPEELLRSLTWDQGTEMALHARFSIATGCPVFFCDPHSPWQRGSNENTNGLLREYYPKGIHTFTTTSQADLDATAAQLNRRPRETLGWRTPAEKLAELLTSNVATTS
ncbi:IS30 family transposase [Dactylosporangium sp. NBC_01737]|uniref:IS30 family transposase n=1 Tax=Dactylosporangium sp. NBC_01737 TaxID=2975959 RepID=UPI003FA34407